MTARARARVVGVGSRLRRDDAIGPALVDRLRAARPDVDAVAAPLDPLSLASALEGARAAVIVDAARGGGAPGDILRLELDRGVLALEARPASTHGAGLAEALAFARATDRLPARVVVYAMVGADFGMGEGFDPRVESALDELARRVLAEADVEHDAAPGWSSAPGNDGMN